MRLVSLRCIILLLMLIVFQLFAQMGDYSSYEYEGRGVVITDDEGKRIKITPYGDYIMRVQTVRSNENFYPDSHYAQVLSHNWDGEINIDESDSLLTISTVNSDCITILIKKKPLRIMFLLKERTSPVLSEDKGTFWEGNSVTESFIPDPEEHFAGLGHPKYGRLDKLDRKGTSVTVTSGNEGACVVPFFLSSKGYGIFLNTTFTHTITLCKNNIYSMKIDGEGYGGRMDYFFIAGPELTKIVDRYTQLTGRPRLPMKSIFGLHLSDKSDPQNSGEQWWKSMITAHRKAGYPLDHQVNDNAWRKSNEQYSTQSNSWFEWRTKDRYPDPKEYREWLNEMGMTMTLDLNRPGIYMIPTWKEEYGIPGTESFPDFTNPQTVSWITKLFNDVAYNSSFGVPADGIWLDEFDYPDHSHSIKLYSGKRWAEESINYHFSLLKACVEYGWDLRFGESKRPYYWVRGITAGAQRYGTYWTGDLCHNWNDMAYQVRAMQSAGISGFPYFNHDAGGHYDGYGDNVCNNAADVEKLFRQWDYGFGSFTPIWKPHGPSHKRWPLQQNSQACREDAMKYCRVRYEMMPYLYSYAHFAARTGIPITRPMFFEDPENGIAWEKDMQYYWGKEMIVAPNCSDGNNEVTIWLPEGEWYDYWTDNKFNGDAIVKYYAATGVTPVFVKAGAIIPEAPYALSTFWIPQDSLNIHVYAGDNGEFTLYEDDGISERYRTKEEFRTTRITYIDKHREVTISGAIGSFSGAPDVRAYCIVYHGLSDVPTLYFDGSVIKLYQSITEIPVNQTGMIWNRDKKLATVILPTNDVKTTLVISTDKDATGLHIRKDVLIKESMITFKSNMFTLHSPSNIGPISVTFFSLDGRVIRNIQDIKYNQTSKGYCCKITSFSSNICIIAVRAGDITISKKVMIR